MSVIIRSETISRWMGQSNTFEKIKAINGKVVRAKEGRKTQRFEIDGQGFYCKYHGGIGWKEIVKNLLQLKLPVVGASNEWLAINRLHKLNLDTLSAVAYGKQGINPARQESFLVTEELTGTLSLAVFAEQWPQTPPPFALKKALIEKVANIAGDIHRHGINHRDLYICHFLLDIAAGEQNINAEAVRLFLVDLHRAQIRSKVPDRWLVKDVGSIYFSAMDVGLTRRDIYRFIKAYTQQPLREALSEHTAFWQRVRQRATRLYIRDWKRPPVEVFD